MSRDQNPNQWQCSIIVTCLCLYHVTSLLHCNWKEFWSRDTGVYLRYIRFGIILTQFYVNFSKQEHQVLWVSINAWNSQVPAYTPFHFSFTVSSNYYFYFYKQNFNCGFYVDLYHYGVRQFWAVLWEKRGKRVYT